MKATVIADSIADGCPRLTTLQLRYPRFIHAEFMTHRVFSRNASSNRAIPVDRMIKDIIDTPAMPVSWNKEQRGMQGGDESDTCVTLTDEYGYWSNVKTNTEAWLATRDSAIMHARAFAAAGYHKQIVNRILEPFQYINVLVTATEWDNFFALRDHPDAQPEIQALARTMKVAMGDSEPVKLNYGEWHTPYVERNGDKRVSSACCASTSYKTVDGKPMTVERALSVFDKLTGDPLHASPFEHIARPDPDNGGGCRNFTRWHQWRADLEGDT
jgi:thymidylate synthase ThyX